MSKYGIPYKRSKAKIVVYCDIPYENSKNKTDYGGGFDNNAFYEWAKTNLMMFIIVVIQILLTEKLYGKKKLEV